MILLVLLGCAGPGGETAGTPAPVNCPPAGETGLSEGDVAQDVTMTRCDGAARSIHGLCGQPALLVNYYGWCASCATNASLGRDLADQYPDLAVAIVLNEDPLSEPVDAEFCDAYVDAYPSGAEVWMDPGGALEVYGTTDLIVVLDAEGTLRFVRETSNEDVIVEAVGGVI